MSRLPRRPRVDDAQRRLIASWLTEEGRFQSPKDAIDKFKVSNGLVYEIMAEFEICEIAKAKVDGQWLRQYGCRPTTRTVQEQAAHDLSLLLVAHYAEPNVRAGAHLTRVAVNPDHAIPISRMLKDGAVPEALGTVNDDFRSGLLWIEPARGYTSEDVVETIRRLAQPGETPTS